MIHVFCNKRGSGKTKALINLANDKVIGAKGNMVYIDDDNRPVLNLDSRLRFISTEDFQINNYNDFYGFLCGILSRDYDVETIFVDGVFNVVPGMLDDTAQLFSKMDKLSHKYNLDFYVNVNCDQSPIPEFVQRYMNPVLS